MFSKTGKQSSWRFIRLIVTVMLYRSFALAGMPGASQRSLPNGLAPTLLVTDLRCEGRAAPVFTDEVNPRFSWVMKATDSSQRNQFQTYWHVQVASTPELLTAGKPDIWNSGKIKGASANNIAYNGKALQSDRKYFWRVRVWDKNGSSSAWSAMAGWQMGLLTEKDWRGSWIKDPAKVPVGNTGLYGDSPAPLFRKTFSLNKKIKKATLHISGLGCFEAYLNGKKIGNGVLEPGQTDYSKRVFYNSYDVSGMLSQTDNCLGVMLGNGWYNPLPLKMWGWLDLRKTLTTGQPAFIAQLNIRFEDGSISEVFTDENWNVTAGPIIRNSVYLGEHYDNRKSIPDWHMPSCSAQGWMSAVTAQRPEGKLQAQPIPPIVIKDTLAPIEIRSAGPEKQIVDFGRNFGGIIRMKVVADKGTKIRVKYGELIYPDGSLNVMTSTAGQIKKTGLGGEAAPDTAYQEDVFIAAGTGLEIFQPRFTFHGFRYVEVNGYPSKISKKDIAGLVMHTDVPFSGSFSCSDSLINKIQEASRNTFLSNLFSVQSDCPHREKFGYGGDILATSEAFMNNFDMRSFYAKTVTDFSDAARSDGGLTETAPFVGIADKALGRNGAGPVEWGSVHPVLLFRLYQYYGDRKMVEEHYPVAKKWVDFLASHAKDYVIDVTIGDHESIDPKDLAVSGTSFFYYNAHLVAWMADLSGNKKDALFYAALAKKIKKSFNEKFVDPATGKVGLGTQATQVHALYLNLLDENVREKALKVLEQEIVAKHSGHIATGMFGTKFITEVLSNDGMEKLAYEMVTKPGFPGWHHMFERGATTIWEHWEFSDGSFSHNHPMFGVVSEWFFRHLAGIRPSENAVGYDKIIIHSKINTGLTSASASYNSINGKVVSKWSVKDGKLNLEVNIPVNTTAEIVIAAKDQKYIQEGGKPVFGSREIQFVRSENGLVHFNVGSGHYRFVADMP